MRVLRGLSSRFLWCGCLVGIYEAYDGGVLAIVDVRGRTCGDPTHVPDATVQFSEEPGSEHDRVPYNGALNEAPRKT